MNTPARFEPMTVGSLLDRTFRIYGANFSLLLGIVAVSYVPVFAVQIVLHGIALQWGGSEGALLIALSNLVVIVLSALVAYPLSEGAATFAVSELYLGRSIGIGQAYRLATPRWGTILNAQISVGLRVLLGILLFLVPGILWALTYMVTVPAVVLERCKAVEGMRRSKALTQGLRGKAFGVMAMITLITFIVAIGVGVGGAMMLPNDTTGVLLQEAFGSLVQLLVTPLAIIAPILLYYDCRIRKEGFDLEMLGQALAGPAAATPAPAP